MVSASKQHEDGRPSWG